MNIYEQFMRILRFQSSTDQTVESNGIQWNPNPMDMDKPHIWNDFWEILWDNLVFSHKYPSFLTHKSILGMNSTTKNDSTVIPRKIIFFFVGKMVEHFRHMGPMNTSQY